MLYQAVKKIPGGKLISVKIEADAQINAVRINGDFFLHPEDSLAQVEKKLAGLPVGIGHGELCGKIHETLLSERAAFLGVTPEEISAVVIDALKNPAAAVPG